MHGDLFYRNFCSKIRAARPRQIKELSGWHHNTQPSVLLCYYPLLRALSKAQALTPPQNETRSLFAFYSFIPLSAAAADKRKFTTVFGVTLNRYMRCVHRSSCYFCTDSVHKKGEIYGRWEKPKIRRGFFVTVSSAAFQSQMKKPKINFKSAKG